jgi:tricorn protease-like protein
MLRIIKIAFLFLTLLAGPAFAQEAGSGWLGVNLKNLAKEEADALGWEAPRGAKVVKAVPNGPAEAAGLKPDDILVSLDNMEIANVKAFIEAVRQKAAGAEIKLAILRAGREKRLALKLSTLPAQLAAAKPAEERPILQLDTGGHMALIWRMAFTPDGKFIVTAGDDKVIRVWDWRTSKTVRTIRGQSGPGLEGKIYGMALSPDGRWLAVGGIPAIFSGSNYIDIGAIRLYDFASGELKALLKGHLNGVQALAFSPDGKRLISGSADNSAIIWDIETQMLLHRLEGHRDHIYAVGFTPDGQRAVTGSFDKTLRLWNVADGIMISLMEGHGDKVRSIAIGPSGMIASGDRSGTILLWDGKTGSPVHGLAKQEAPVSSLSFSPDGKWLLSGSGVGPGAHHPLVYDVASLRQIVAYTGHDSVVGAVAFSPDGHWAASAGGRTTMQSTSGILLQASLQLVRMGYRCG